MLLDVRPAEQYNICHLPGGQGALEGVRGRKGVPREGGRQAERGGKHEGPRALAPLVPFAGAVHAPFKQFDRHVDAIRERLAATAGAGGGDEENGSPPLYVVCRRGNDSQRAVARLRQLGIAHAVDVVGGMEGWAREVDPGFPTY